MSTTASQNLNLAHRQVFDLAQKAAVIFSGHEGLGASLTVADVTSGIGLDYHEMSATDRFLVLLAVTAAAEFRGWKEVQEQGQPKLFRKPIASRHYRKPSSAPRRAS